MLWALCVKHARPSALDQSQCFMSSKVPTAIPKCSTEGKAEECNSCSEASHVEEDQDGCDGP